MRLCDVLCPARSRTHELGRALGQRGAARTLDHARAREHPGSGVGGARIDELRCGQAPARHVQRGELGRSAREQGIVGIVAKALTQHEVERDDQRR